MLTEEQPKKASSQTLRSRKQDRTTLRVVVNIGKSELEMLRTSNAATGSLAPLARFTIENLWVAFRYCPSYSALAMRDCENTWEMLNVMMYASMWSSVPVDACVDVDCSLQAGLAQTIVYLVIGRI